MEGRDTEAGAAPHRPVIVDSALWTGSAGDRDPVPAATEEDMKGCGHAALFCLTAGALLPAVFLTLLALVLRLLEMSFGLGPEDIKRAQFYISGLFIVLGLWLLLTGNWRGERLWAAGDTDWANSCIKVGLAQSIWSTSSIRQYT